MGQPRTGFSTGTDILGALSTTDASAGLEIPLHRPDGARIHVGPSDQLKVVTLGMVLVAGGAGYIYADYAGVAPVNSASTGNDEFTIVGDVSGFLRTGDRFTVYGSTGNDAAYTITAIAFDFVTDLTTIGVASVASGTGDGFLAWLFFDITGASASANTLTIAGDQRAYFEVGRLFRVDGSTGNDNGGSNYTTTAAVYDADADTTTISVASIANNTADGRIIPQQTDSAGRRYLQGTYGANGGRERTYSDRLELHPGFTLYGDAAAGQANFEAQAFLKKDIRPLPV